MFLSKYIHEGRQSCCWIEMYNRWWMINDNAVSIAISLDSTITVALLQCHCCHHENDTCCVYPGTNWSVSSYVRGPGPMIIWSSHPLGCLDSNEHWIFSNSTSPVQWVLNSRKCPAWACICTPRPKSISCSTCEKLCGGKCMYYSTFSFAVQVVMSPFFTKTAMRTSGCPK